MVMMIEEEGDLASKTGFQLLDGMSQSLPNTTLDALGRLVIQELEIESDVVLLRPLVPGTNRRAEKVSSA